VITQGIIDLSEAAQSASLSATVFVSFVNICFLAAGIIIGLRIRAARN
jgi:hypothetical protein